MDEIKLFDSLSFKIDDGKPVFGGMNMNLELGPLKATAEVSDGEFKIALGPRFDAGTYDTTTKKFKPGGWESFTDTFKKMKADVKKGMEANTFAKKYQKTTGKPNIKVKSGIDGDVYGAGYIAGYIDKNGGWHINEGGLIIQGGAKYTHYGQTIIGVIPVCYEFGGEIGAQLNGGIKSVTDWNSIQFSGSLKPYVSGNVYGGVGVAFFGSLGLSGKATLNIEIALDRNYQKVDLTGQADFVAKLWGADLYSLKIAKGTWVIYETGRNRAASLNAAATGLFDNINYNTVGNWEERTVASQWLSGTPSPGLLFSLNQTVDDLAVLQENLYEDAAPKLAKMGDKTILYWIADANGRSDANKSMLVYSVQNGSVWSQPQAVSDDGTADFLPTVCDGYIAWHNSKHQFNDATTTLGDIAAAGEIAVAKWNGAGFDAPVAVTNNGTLDTYPILAKSGETVSVVYLTNSENDAFGTSGTNRIMRSDLNSGVWSASSQIYQTTKPIISMDACIDSGDLNTVFVLDDDSNLNTLEDRDIWLYRDGTASNITSDDKIQAKPEIETVNGSPTLFYYENGNIAYRALGGGQAQTVLDEETTIQSDQYTVIPGENGDMTIVYPRFEDGGAEIWGVIYNDGQWSQPVQFSNTGEHVKTIDGIQNGDGSYLFAINRAKKILEEDDYYSYGQSDLCVINSTAGYDLAVSGVYCDDALIERDQPLPVNMVITNLGQKAVSGYTVTIKNGDTTTNNTGIFDEPLLPGASAEISVDYLVPSNFTKQTISIAVSQSQGMETDTENDTETLTIGHKDIAVKDVEVVGLFPDHKVWATISNIGFEDAENIQVQLRKESEEGAVLATRTISSLDIGEEQEVTFDIEAPEIGSDTQIYYITATPLSDEEFTGNNSGYALQFVPQEQFYYAVVESSYNPSTKSVDVIAIVNQNSTQATQKQVILKVTDGQTIGSVSQIESFNSSGEKMISTSIPVSRQPSSGYSVEINFAEYVEATSVTVSPTSKTLLVGGTQQLSATVKPDDATDKSVTWSSDKTSVATVSSTGLVTAKAVGTATITAKTSNGKTTTCQITVNPIVPTGVTISSTSKTLNIGNTTQLSATVAPSNATDKSVAWVSDKTSVATVSSTGLVKAIAAGTATITVKTNSGGKTATCKITVNPATPTTVKVTKVSLSNTVSTMVFGNTRTLQATVTPTNATNKAVTWSSSNAKVVKVDQKGKITAVGSGKATIKATAKDSSKKSASVTITVHQYVTMQMGKTTAIMNGTKTSIDNAGTKPFKISGKTMLPLRFVGEKMGGKVKYVNDKTPITMSYGNTKVEFKLGDKKMKVITGSSTKIITLDVAAQKVKGKTYIPLRAIGQALGFDVYYEAGTEYIVVNNPKMTPEVKKERLAEAKKVIK